MPLRTTLYDPTHERDACGIGFVADAHGRASRDVLDLAAEALRREHWLDAGVWAPSLYAAEARSAILRHVAVTGDE